MYVGDDRPPNKVQIHKVEAPQLMDLQSFYRPLRMELKAPFADSEGFLWSEWITDFSKEKESHSRI